MTEWQLICKPRAFATTKLTLRAGLGILLLAVPWVVGATGPSFTSNVPDCRVVTSQSLPAKFYSLARKYQEYEWVTKVSTLDDVAGGSSLERTEGVYNWITMYRLDIDGDGLCDWFVVALAPFNTGGDGDLMNVIYLQTASGWSRFGPSIPENEPDELGRGDSDRDQSKFLFGENIVVVRDSANARNYLILSTGSRRASLGERNGYQVYVWDQKASELKKLDKWDLSSPASKAYDYFRKHGGWQPKGSDAKRVVAAFDPDVENSEREFRCTQDDSKPAFCLTKADAPVKGTASADGLWGNLDEARYVRIRAKVSVVELTDRRMNEAYRDRLKALDAIGQSLLKASQRAWLRCRSSWSVGPQSLADGTITIAQLVDRETLQIQRIRDFDPGQSNEPPPCDGQR